MNVDSCCLQAGDRVERVDACKRAHLLCLRRFASIGLNSKLRDHMDELILSAAAAAVVFAAIVSRAHSSTSHVLV